MGGYEGGQEASRLAVETLVEVYREFAGTIRSRRLPSHAGRPPTNPALQFFASGVARHGNNLHAAAIVQDALYYAHVGDSRLYLIRDAGLLGSRATIPMWADWWRRE